jgi:hypothetical protein
LAIDRGNKVAQTAAHFAAAPHTPSLKRRKRSTYPHRELLCSQSGWVSIRWKSRVTDRRNSTTKLKNIRFPLPPREEQLRIVARVESLRRLCADLRQRLTARQSTQSQLAEALIHEVA